MSVTENCKAIRFCVRLGHIYDIIRREIVGLWTVWLLIILILMLCSLLLVNYRKTSDSSPRLLSVQVSQTPGLYAGSGVYPGPGLYHNMSSLCYFIQRNRQLSCLPGTSILFIFTLKHRTLRRCKRGLQSLLFISLKKYSYKDRLIQLNLPTPKVQKIAMGNDGSL